MLVVTNPTPAEQSLVWDLVRGGVAYVESRQPFAEVAPVEGPDGRFWAKHEIHGDPYFIVCFEPQEGETDATT